MIKSKSKNKKIFTLLFVAVLFFIIGYLSYNLYVSNNLIYEKDSKISDLEKKNSTLKVQFTKSVLQLDNYKSKCNFMDDYVAICPVDGKGLYHQHNCNKYDSSKSFYIYNIGQAEQQGFNPCPDCEKNVVDNSEDASDVVYITNEGTKYHRSWCSYLSSSKKAININDAIDKGYAPCSRCSP